MTTHTTPIDLREFHGRYVEATIEGITFKGKLSINSKGHVYICHNCFKLKRPNYVEEMFGYDYNYCAQLSGEEVCADSITYITLLDEPNPVNPEWDWKDGEIVRLDNREYKVCKVHDDIVVFIVDGRSTGSYTNQEAYIEGWRKLPPQPQRKLVEITEEMFRSTAWYGKKVLYGELEQGVYAVHYNSGFFTLVQSGTVHYSQCKLIEE